MSLRRIMLMAAAFLAAALVWVGPASAASIGGFGARPAHYNPAVPATRAYFIRDIAAAGSFSDAVIAFNNGSAPMTLRVYPVDGLTGATSGVVYGNRTTPLRGAGQWVTLEHPEVVVPAHSQVTIPFSVSVPADASPGVHLAGLALEDADTHASGGHFSVTEVLRTVVGVELRVPGATYSQIALHELHVDRASTSGDAGFIVGVDNVGTNLCKPTLSLSITGPGGAQRVTRRLDTVLPGSAIPYPVMWPRALARGNYDTAVAASGCGPTSVLRGSTFVGRRLPRAGTPAAAPGRSSPAIRNSSASVPAWWLIALVGAGGIGIGIGAAFSRGRRRVGFEH